MNTKGESAMKLEYNKNKLQALMKDFYLLTGIRIVLFDSDYTELLSYPETHCQFCAYMKTPLQIQSSV